MIPPDVLDLARQILTPAQYEAWILEARWGWGTNRIALHLNLARSSANDRLYAARRNLINAGVRVDASRNYTLGDTI